MTHDAMNGKGPLASLTRAAKALTLKSAGALFPDKLVKAVMQDIKVGCLTVDTPDSGRWILGDPSSSLRCHVTVRRDVLFDNLVRYWDIGLGESYQAGDYEVDDLPAFLRLIILNLPHLPGISGSVVKGPVNRHAEENVGIHGRRGNTLAGSKANIAYHYDLGNEFYALFLDPTLAYSSAVFRDAGESLESAQVRKFDLLCRKLELKSSDHVLEIGTGWGGFALHAATRYGCRVTSLTLSREQKALSEERVRAAGLSDRIEVRLQDYREAAGRFEKIASIEMFEAVGYEYFGTFFAKCAELLKPEGLMAMQVITMPDSRFEAYRNGCDWIQKHIFPGCLLPSVAELARAIGRSGLGIHHLENYDLHYARTLREWRRAFRARTAEVKALGFDERFLRTWDYYLAYCEAAFDTRNLGLVQLVLTRPNNLGLRGPNAWEGA